MPGNVAVAIGSLDCSLTYDAAESTNLGAMVIYGYEDMTLMIGSGVDVESIETVDQLSYYDRAIAAIKQRISMKLPPTM